jgi:hypothetical protein
MAIANTTRSRTPKAHVQRPSGHLVRSSIPASFRFVLRGGVLHARGRTQGKEANRRRRESELSDVTEFAVPENDATKSANRQVSAEPLELLRRGQSHDPSSSNWPYQHRSHEVRTPLNRSGRHLCSKPRRHDAGQAKVRITDYRPSECGSCFGTRSRLLL